MAAQEHDPATRPVDTREPAEIEQTRPGTTQTPDAEDDRPERTTRETSRPGGADPHDADPDGADPGDAEPDDADPDDQHRGRFGVPGAPLNRRNPFFIGFVGGLGLLLAYGTFLGLRNAASILVLIFVALFLAIGLNPAVNRLRRAHLPRGLAVAVVALVMVGLVAGAVIALIPPLVTQTTELINNVPGFIRSLQRNETVNELVERYDILNKVQSALDAGTVGNALGGVVGGARLIFGTIFNVLTVLVLTIYFMAAFERLKESAYALVPASRRTRVRLLTDEILSKVGGYMVGALAIAVLAGLSTWVFAMIVGLAYPFALAVVVAVCDLIPQIGATLGAVIVSLVGVASSLYTGIACAVFFIVYQQVENYLIYPRVMRRSVQVSDVAAVVAALLGVALFGVVGALVAIPMVAGVQLLIREVVRPSMQRR
ncbi:AI-2E family transporter [Mangrovihabitans endophyticus]|uniref:AI-2E family transporter n=1 Tax=Mangrovihabitans endophyticus TaxID=1751298 RepID=A0A8J3C083_9ACTN|nr:AI-2E family transporter [Mangrovihabitans endophyticus]GGK98996.1 AI-2E family transporter [Mangrovihabitans endophyticus]